jgi:hypothetical protein
MRRPLPEESLVGLPYKEARQILVHHAGMQPGPALLLLTRAPLVCHFSAGDADSSVSATFTKEGAALGLTFKESAEGALEVKEVVANSQAASLPQLKVGLTLTAVGGGSPTIDWLEHEIHLARQLGKPIIPLTREGIDTNGSFPKLETLPPEIAELAALESVPAVTSYGRNMAEGNWPGEVARIVKGAEARSRVELATRSVWESWVLNRKVNAVLAVLADTAKACESHIDGASWRALVPVIHSSLRAQRAEDTVVRETWEEWQAVEVALNAEAAKQGVDEIARVNLPVSDVMVARRAGTHPRQLDRLVTDAVEAWKNRQTGTADIRETEKVYQSVWDPSENTTMRSAKMTDVERASASEQRLQRENEARVAQCRAVLDSRRTLLVADKQKLHEVQTECEQVEEAARTGPQFWQLDGAVGALKARVESRERQLVQRQEGVLDAANELAIALAHAVHNRTYATMDGNPGGSVYERRAPNEILPLLDEVLTGRRDLLGEDHPRTLDVRVGKAAVTFSFALFQTLTSTQNRQLQAYGQDMDTDAAERIFEPEPNPLAEQIAAGHAELLDGLVQEVRETLEVLQANLGPGHPSSLLCALALADMLNAWARPNAVYSEGRSDDYHQQQELRTADNVPVLAGPDASRYDDEAKSLSSAALTGLEAATSSGIGKPDLAWATGLHKAIHGPGCSHETIRSTSTSTSGKRDDDDPRHGKPQGTRVV